MIRWILILATQINLTFIYDNEHNKDNRYQQRDYIVNWKSIKCLEGQNEPSGKHRKNASARQTLAGISPLYFYHIQALMVQRFASNCNLFFFLFFLHFRTNKGLSF